MSGAAAGPGLPGLDLDALQAHLEAACPGLLTGPLTGELIAGGKSNLTYAVTDGTQTVVVRRPPLGHVLPTAHDMAREYRVLTALADEAVPVPRTHVLCEDDAVLGAPFYVMAKAPGTPYRSAAQLAALGPQRTAAIAAAMMDTLGALHSVDPQAVGLGDFGRPDGFFARQVRRWGAQLDASRSRDLAGADELAGLLAQASPPPQAPAIVHGDYRLDNLLVEAEDGRDVVRAVLDWEMATLGDPLTDLGLLLVYSRLAQLAPSAAALVTDVSAAPGFPDPAELSARYARASGRDLGALGLYVGLGFFKLAVIAEGIYRRHTMGATVGDGFARLGESVEALMASGIAAIKEA